ncbi:tRNA-splicing endonuclease subunit Sen15 isoform 1-T2 [Anomaloglossus baeobatrachus]|uniref:tRNA-splicing endonuclease subunit Sen15 n=1 Tax=Anomaloglossus baeobatrachus TaxID=238106 RepID=UPI003F508228
MTSIPMDCSDPLPAGAREGEEPWIEQHPKFKEMMMMMDVAESTQVYAAFLVYMDLLEVRNWNSVQILSSPELHLIYLCGKEKDADTPQVIVPTPVTMSFCHLRIQELLKLNDTSEEAQTSESSALLAIVETDSTIVYYKLTDGLVMPDPPDFAEDVDNKRWKKKKMRLLR